MVIESKILLSTLNIYRKLGKYCDVIIQVGSKEFPCHKLILSAAVPYFDAMFGGNFKEKNVETVSLKNIDVTGFEHVLNYIYGEKLVLNVQNATKMLTVASFFCLESVKRKYIESLRKNLNRYNVCRIYLYACETGIDNLMCYCREFIERHFSKVSKTQSFCQIPFPILTDLISSRYLVIANETDMFDALVKWIDYDRKLRYCYASNLMTYVNFRAIDLKTVVYGSVNKRFVSKYAKSNKDLEICDNQPKRIFIFEQSCAVKNKPIVSATWCTKKFKGVLHHLTNYINANRFDVVNLNDSIYMFSQVDSRSENYFQRLNMRSGRWIKLAVPFEIASMYDVASANCYNSVYVNFNKIKYRNYQQNWSTYCYNCDIDRWYTIPISLYSSHLVTSKQVMYLLGGRDSNNQEVGLQLYDPRMENAVAVHHETISKHASVACLDDKIYISGGCYSKKSTSNIVKVFDIKASKFYSAKPMVRTRKRHSMIAYNNKLCVFGGGYRKMEIYDPKTDNWELGFFFKALHSTFDLKSVVI